MVSWKTLLAVQVEVEAPNLDERGLLLGSMLCPGDPTQQAPSWLQDAAAQTAGLLPRVSWCFDFCAKTKRMKTYYLF